MVGRNSITLRPEQAADWPFLEALYASTRREELAIAPWSDEQKQQFLSMQFKVQHRYYQQVYPNARYDVIELEGKPVGRLYVARDPKELTVLDIALTPEVRGCGIGSALLTELMAESQSAGQVVRLSVENNNRARTLYERLGFQVCDRSDFYFHMEWNPPATVTSST